jgi:thiol-disulfide isomerase/thioredoxin
MLKDKFPSLPQGKAILCFYSPTCSHCMETAKALQELKQRTGIEKHHVVFMIEGADTEKKIQKFLNTTKLSAKYTTMEFIDFPTDTDPPAILLVNNGKVESRFFGNDKNKFEKAAFLKAFNSLEE